jgi:hypothetical protein
VKAPAERSWKAYSTLIGGFIHMNYIGCTYIIGNICPYIALYFDVSFVEASEVGLLSLFLISILSPAGAYLVQHGV